MSNLKKPITYEELIHSQFILTPSFNKYLYKIFNPIAAVIALLIIVMIIGYSLHIDITIVIICAVVGGLYIPVRMQSAFVQMYGHGVGLKKKDNFSFLGFPKLYSILTIVVLIVASIMVGLAFLGDFAFIETAKNMRFFSSTVFSSLIISLCSWRFHFYYVTFYGNEYTAREQLKKKGYSGERLESAIKNLRKAGILEYEWKKIRG